MSHRDHDARLTRQRLEARERHVREALLKGPPRLVVRSSGSSSAPASRPAAPPPAPAPAEMLATPPRPPAPAPPPAPPPLAPAPPAPPPAPPAAAEPEIAPDLQDLLLYLYDEIGALRQDVRAQTEAAGRQAAAAEQQAGALAELLALLRQIAAAPAPSAEDLPPGWQDRFRAYVRSPDAKAVARAGVLTLDAIFTAINERNLNGYQRYAGQILAEEGYLPVADGRVRRYIENPERGPTP